jgi:hypothetical protein
MALILRGSFLELFGTRRYGRGISQGILGIIFVSTIMVTAPLKYTNIGLVIIVELISVYFLIAFIYGVRAYLQYLSLVNSISIYTTTDNKLVIETVIPKENTVRQVSATRCWVSEYYRKERSSSQYSSWKKIIKNIIIGFITSLNFDELKYLSRKTFVFDLPVRIRKVKVSIKDSPTFCLGVIDPKKFDELYGVGNFYVLGSAIYPGLVYGLKINSNEINDIKNEIEYYDKICEREPRLCDFNERVKLRVKLMDRVIKIVHNFVYNHTLEGYLINDSYLILGLSNAINELLKYSTLEE